MSVKQLLAVERGNKPVGLTSCRFMGREVALSPDVMVTGFRDVSLLEAQTPAAAHWLSSRYQTEMGSAWDQLRTNSSDSNRIIRELQAAGFRVLVYHQD